MATGVDADADADAAVDAIPDPAPPSVGEKDDGKDVAVAFGAGLGVTPGSEAVDVDDADDDKGSDLGCDFDADCSRTEVGEEDKVRLVPANAESARAADARSVLSSCMNCRD